ncbi:OmpH family outer membrane protein [Deinococcus pimensis]|uniref:OmpH family outer membrane protein n=1 Tax=Deinococcus pimensis TaxID=309888 RepID=UPI0004B8E87A|nr:OmpH family outer membrane protein [Deinococcus pimensis]
MNIHLTINGKQASKVLLALPLALLVTAPHAQKAGAKVGFVNVQKVLEATPGGQTVAAVRKQADTELGAQAKKIQALQQKANTGPLSAADRQALDTYVKTYNATTQKYQKQIADKFAPVAKTVNNAVAVTARAQGYSMVFDYAIAQQSGLVIYADTKSTDLTQAVVNQVKKK